MHIDEIIEKLKYLEIILLFSLSQYTNILDPDPIVQNHDDTNIRW